MTETRFTRRQTHFFIADWESKMMMDEDLCMMLMAGNVEIGNNYDFGFRIFADNEESICSVWVTAVNADQCNIDFITIEKNDVRVKFSKVVPSETTGDCILNTLFPHNLSKKD